MSEGSKIQLIRSKLLKKKEDKVRKTSRKKKIQTFDQDALLTGKPVLNFFHQSFQQYYDFAEDIRVHHSRSTPDFGKRLVFRLGSNISHYLGDTFLYFKLPPLVATSGTYAAWTQTIGYAIIEAAEFRIAEQRIQIYESELMEIFDELHTPESQRAVRNLLIGKFVSLSALQINAVSATEYYVPLPFFFTGTLEKALPLYLMQNCSFEFIITLRPFSECTVYDGATAPVAVDISECYLVTRQFTAEDSLIRNEVAEVQKNGRGILFEDVQFHGDESIDSGLTSSKISLTFNNPVKEVLFVLRDINSEANNDWFNYSRYSDGRNPLENLQLLLEGHVRFNTTIPEAWFRTVAPLVHHTHASDRYIFSLPLCEYPEKYQPSGTLNFSKFDSIDLFLNLVSGNSTMILKPYAVGYQMLVLDGEGNAALYWRD